MAANCSANGPLFAQSGLPVPKRSGIVWAVCSMLPSARSRKVSHVQESCLHVIDVARARKFYEETLGLKSGSVGNQGDNWWVEYDLPGGVHSPVCRMALCLDSEGNSILLHQLKPK
jgi:predicted enzyme related to lactoylglutathione lyase